MIPMIVCTFSILLLASLLGYIIGQEVLYSINVLNLTMTVFSSVTGQTDEYDTAFPLFQDSSIIANELCSYLHYTGDRLTKCTIGVDQTVKNGKIQQLHHLINTYFPNAFNDGELFPLTYAYDFQSHESKTVCIFGYPEYSALLLAVATINVREVHVFSGIPDRFVQSTPASHAYELSATFGTKLFVHFAELVEDRLLLMQRMNLHCDVTHLASNTSDEEALQILSALHMQKEHSNVSFNDRVVWTRLWNQTTFSASTVNKSVIPQELDFEIDWQIMSLWPHPSSIQELFDPTGFSARGFTMYPNPLLMQVLIGKLVNRHDYSILEHKRQQCVDPSTAKHSVILITYTIRVFADSAFGLQSALQRIGYHNVLVVNMNLDTVDVIQQQITNGDILQIAIGPHDMTMFLRRYVVFQMEQLWSVIGGSSEEGTRYSAVLGGAVGILTFSEKHAEILRGRGYEKVFNIPIYTRTTDTINEGVVDESIDVLFFGSCSPRRVDIINNLIRSINQHNEMHPERQVILDHHCGGWNKTIYDEKLSYHVLRSKIVLNVHTEEDSVLEIHRINYLLSKGRVVVSERSQDVSLDAQYNESVYFIDSVNSGVLLNQLLELLFMSDARQAIKVKAKQKDREIQSDVDVLAVAVSAFVNVCL